MCNFIDYLKPIHSNLDDLTFNEKYQFFLQILQTKPSKYDAKAEIKKAEENLRKQGVKVITI